MTTENGQSSASVDSIVLRLLADPQIVKIHWQDDDVLWGVIRKLSAMVRNHNVVINNAVDVVRKASIGDQNFIKCLRGDDPNTTALRHAIVELGDALRDA